MSKVWFITGCSKGFGRSLTEELLKSTDALVVATARDPSTLKDLEKSHPDRLLVLKLDVTEDDDIEQSVKATLDRFGRIDILVNNAGYGIIGALEECSMDEIEDVFDVNVFGLMEVTKAILPIMRENKSGHIFNISSIAGISGSPGFGIYNATKFAVSGLSESLSGEVSNFGIKVTNIEPGPFRTDFAGGSLHSTRTISEYGGTPSAQMRDYINKVDHKQIGDPVKAAQVIIKLAKMEDPPVHMLLGNPAMDRAIPKLKKQIDEYIKFEELTRSADYES